MNDTPPVVISFGPYHFEVDAKIFEAWFSRFLSRVGTKPEEVQAEIFRRLGIYGD